MTPQAEGGSDSIENAIPLCFECHAEIHSYNDKHPRGRKFRPEELSAHKQQWLDVCKDSVSQLLVAGRSTDVGPLQAMLDELEFNLQVEEDLDLKLKGNPVFAVEQFHRAVGQGSLSILDERLKKAIHVAYAKINKMNQLLAARCSQTGRDDAIGSIQTELYEARKDLREKIELAFNILLGFLGNESNTETN